MASLPSGAGRGDRTPTLLLVADLSGKVPEMGAQSATARLEFEFYGKDGVIRTEIGWRVVTMINESPTNLRFRIAERTEPDPTDLDRRIAERAREILATESVWDRADDRKCAPDDKTWSMYCAIERASRDVTGGFHHRRPVLQVVRNILWERVAEERKRGRKYPHILMDYNNDAAIGLEDVQSVFADAIARMKR